MCVYALTHWVFPQSGSVLFLSKVMPVTMAAAPALNLSLFLFLPFLPLSFSLCSHLSFPFSLLVLRLSVLYLSLSLCSLDQRHSKQATSHHLRGTVGPRPGSPISGREIYGNYRNVTHIATMLSGKSSMNMGWITISPIFL